MPKRLYAILLFLFSLLGIFSVLLIWNYQNQPEKSKEASNLEIFFLDVGQGDSAIIKTPAGQNILVDGGPDDKVVKEISRHLNWWDKKIDLVILTHPHSDHVAGLIPVQKRYEIGQILSTGVIHNSPDYLKWLELVKEKKTPLTIIDRPQKIILGENCFLDVLSPRHNLAGKEIPNLNNASIVFRLIYGETSFLFTGDAENIIEDEILSANKNLASDVLKVSHHGSSNATGEKFIAAVKPKISIISVGKDNAFGHPSRKTLNKLERIGSAIYRTDLQGAISIRSDGKKIDIKK